MSPFEADLVLFRLTRRPSVPLEEHLSSLGAEARLAP
jgi:hypothetical protein